MTRYSGIGFGFLKCGCKKKVVRVRTGVKDANGTVHWTAASNVEVVAA